MIPGLNDAELERILAACAAAGATRAGYVLLRLPLEIRAAVRGLGAGRISPTAPRASWRWCGRRGAGRLYDSRFGTRQTGTGAYADMLAARFRLAVGRLGLGGARVVSQALDCSQFAPPPAGPGPGPAAAAGTAVGLVRRR